MAENDNRGERISDALFGNEEIRFRSYFEQEGSGLNLAGAFEIAQGVFIWLLRDFSGYPLFVTHFSPPRLPSGRAREARGRKMLESGGKRSW